MDEEYRIITDAWRFFRMWRIDPVPEKNSPYWNDLMKTGEELMRKYNNREFACDIIAAMILELDRRLEGHT